MQFCSFAVLHGCTVLYCTVHESTGHTYSFARYDISSIMLLKSDVVIRRSSPSFVVQIQYIYLILESGNRGAHLMGNRVRSTGVRSTEYGAELLTRIFFNM